MSCSKSVRSCIPSHRFRILCKVPLISKPSLRWAWPPHKVFLHAYYDKNHSAYVQLSRLLKQTLAIWICQHMSSQSTNGSVTLWTMLSWCCLSELLGIAHQSWPLDSSSCILAGTSWAYTWKYKQKDLGWPNASSSCRALQGSCRTVPIDSLRMPRHARGQSTPI